MRIMLDTNVLISMVFFPGKRFQKMMEYAQTLQKPWPKVLNLMVAGVQIFQTVRKTPAFKFHSICGAKKWALRNI